MKTMTRISTILLIGLIGIAGLAHAYELPDSPIHSQMRYQLLAASDDFSDLNKPASRDSKSASEQTDPKKISIVKSGLYSALLPGLGEYKLGHKTKAKYFFGAEALSWLGFAAFKIYGNWKEDDYIEFAAEKANAQLEGKDDAFIDLVGFYESLDQYNTLGRVSDRERPFLLDTPENHWYWESETDQRAFRDLKNESRSAYRNADFMLGVLVFNRLVSIIDAVRDAKRAKSHFRSGFTNENSYNYKLSVNPFSVSKQIELTVYTPF